MTPGHNNDPATRVSSMRYFLELYLKGGYLNNKSFIGSVPMGILYGGKISVVSGDVNQLQGFA